MRTERVCSILTKFQFHKGTIRTCSEMLVQAYTKDFNSIKVQLERTKVRKLPQHQNNFNSIKVQLEHIAFCV